MTGTWWKMCDRQTDRRTDRQTDNEVFLVLSQLKIVNIMGTFYRTFPAILRVLSTAIFLKRNQLIQWKVLSNADHCSWLNRWYRHQIDGGRIVHAVRWDSKLAVNNWSDRVASSDPIVAWIGPRMLHLIPLNCTSMLNWQRICLIESK